MASGPSSSATASVDPHRALSDVAGRIWQPLQQEANDVANLRLDHMKQVVAPPVKVKRGRKVDLTQVQRRAQNSVIQVQAMDDVEWAEVPDVPPSSYQETNYINADFDDLAGIVQRARCRRTAPERDGRRHEACSRAMPTRSPTSTSKLGLRRGSSRHCSRCFASRSTTRATPRFSKSPASAPALGEVRRQRNHRRNAPRRKSR
jgi:hypothetical protein